MAAARGRVAIGARGKVLGGVFSSLAALAAGAWPGAGWSQGTDAPSAPASPRPFALSSGLAFEASVIDVSRRANGANGAEVLVQARPSLTITQRGGRLTGSLTYGGTLFSRRGIDDREDTDYTNTLNANYLLEAIDGIGFVDARASVTQQAISAVGTPVGAAGSESNRAEVITASLSPYLRGLLGNAAEYELRATGAGTKTEDSSVSSSKSAQASVSVRSPRRSSLFGWGLSGVRQKVKFAAASSSTTSDRVAAELTFQPDVDWRISLNGGEERTDVVGAMRRGYENYGIGVQWAPSPRTTVSLQGEERYFGRAHRVLVEHRLQRSTFRYSDARDVTSGADTLGVGQPVTSGGLFSSAGIAAQTRRDLVWTWAGPRLTLSASAFTVDSERVDNSGVNPAGLNDNVAQTGYAASIGWRMTPLASITASGSRAMGKDTATSVRSDLKSVSLGLSSRLGVRMTGALTGRYSVLNGSTDSYRETALAASLSLQF